MWLLLLGLVAVIYLYRWNRQRQILENLTDKYVLITGCDSGFGNLAARQLDKRGLKVLATCLTEKGAEDLKKETSSRLQTTIMDVTDSQSVSNAVQWADNITGSAGLWGLVNNAGIYIPIGPNEWMKKEDYVKILNVNLLGMIDVTLKLLPLVRRAKGRIVNISSSAGRVNFFGGGYGISKHGVEAFSDSLRRELSCFGIRVSIIEPGAFKTMSDVTLFKGSFEKMLENIPADIKENYGEQHINQSLQRMGKFMKYCSTNLSMVTDCMEHALTARYPWTRYSPGWDVKFFYIPLSYLPTVISDYVL
ncbi:hypothetical protein GDO86_004320 [Hymenochirus boettgeri]|uniref:Uncharacterized protein n=1 Tax=Hymenochirus boettgeri TaxID=247094 RepID=A0A8T2K7V2_9PIPI|nr:hypothetical protein GDO86_004320 [Hymenochirus boettgeri]